MKKIYNSSGEEVKRPIMGVCPTCGFWKCEGYQHCLNCGQPLRFESYEWDKEHYTEHYKSLEEEIAALDSMKLNDIFTDNILKPLSKRREEIRSGQNAVFFDVEELYKGRLVEIHPDGKRELVYSGIDLTQYDIE